MSDERGTGRTQRMLDRAADALREGKRVAIVGAHGAHTVDLQRRMTAMVPDSASFLVASFVYLPENRDRFDLVLWDHYAHEVWTDTLASQHTRRRLEVEEAEYRLAAARRALDETRREQSEHAKAVVG